MPKLLLLDGHSLAYRAFFALPTDLATKNGTVTNAVYGFTSMLAKVLADEKPDYIAVAFDAPGGSTYRYELDPEYKAGRKETPDLFSSQLPLIHEVLEALEITQLKVSGVEADDVIATLTVQAEAAGSDVVIVTGDRDSYQLVRDPHVKVLYNKRGVSDYVLYDEAGIAERCLGVTPRQYLDYASLRGDTSDNLPGVPGIGEKTAAKLITTYGDLEGVYEHLDELPPKQRTNLGEAKDRVFKNREMSRLYLEVDLDGLKTEDLAQGAFDRERLRVLFDQLEFRTLLPRILDAVGAAAEAPEAETLDVDVVIARDGKAVVAALKAAAKAERVAIEPRWEGRSVAGLAISTGSDATYLDGDLVRDAKVRDALTALVGPKGPKLVVHRSKELMHGLDEQALPSLDLDTAVMAYLLDPGEGKYRLEDLALRYLSVELTSPDQVEGTLDFDGESGAHETARRVAVLIRLADTLSEALAARELVDLYERIERPLIPVLVEMEAAGVRIDVAFLNDLGKELGDECRRLEAEIHQHAGETFNVNSTPQLRLVLFEKLGLTPVKKTKTGPSTDADSLQKMADDHPIVESLLRYREVEKLRSTYADALPPLVRDDGRIHATFNQIATTTGRISSESPNLQNVPVRTSTGRELRKAFIAADGCGLLTADYSQIELRVMAHLAEDPGLIEAFERGADVHTTTAARVFDTTEEKVDDFQRRFAKVVNYGLAYGMEAYGLAERLDIATEQAREILDAYFAAFPNIAAYMKETVREAKSTGYTTTLFGRRRQLPELSSDNFRIRQMGERMAQNAPVQGSAADIFKLAMVDLGQALTAGKFESRMILTVHDELVLEVPLGERERVEPVVREVMENVTELRVPLTVDMGFGPTWADANERVSQPPDDLWFNEIAAYLGPAYLRNAFTKGTVQEVDFLVDALALEPGSRVLDVGCGPGRHALELGRRGIEVVGIDASAEFVALARAQAADLPVTFRELDVRALDLTDEFDAVICLCQGGFGLLGGGEDELRILDRLACALRRGGRLALSAFSSYFVVRHLEAGESFDAEHGVNHERALVRDEAGREQPFDLWTTCYTPRELRLLAERAGLLVDGVYGVRPGRYARAATSIDTPEHLLLAHRPESAGVSPRGPDEYP